MSKQHILIVEDDEDIQQLVSFNLMKAGFHVSCANDGEEGLAVLQKEKIDCLLLDIMLSGDSGLEICRHLRKDGGDLSLPIIMITAKGSEAEIIEGLEAGADDYIVKPFSPKVLIARVKAAMRRQSRESSTVPSQGEETISIQGLQIFPGRHEVLVHGQEVQLTLTEFKILTLLARRPGWVFSRQQIIDAVRGYDYAVTPRMIDVQVFSLRKKLGEAEKNIETVRGIGYRFKD